MTTMRVVGECFFWYRLTRVFPDKFHRAVKRLCCVLCVKVQSVTVVILINLPIQVNPSPVNLSKQVHLKLPAVFLQSANSLQPPLFDVHSSISVVIERQLTECYA